MAPSEFYLQMALVAVPATVVTALLRKSEPASDAAVPAHPTSVHSKMLQDFLHYERHVECPVKCLEDNLFVRISAAPYNCMDDYAALAEAVLAYCDI